MSVKSTVKTYKEDVVARMGADFPDWRVYKLDHLFSEACKPPKRQEVFIGYGGGPMVDTGSTDVEMEAQIFAYMRYPLSLKNAFDNLDGNIARLSAWINYRAFAYSGPSILERASSLGADPDTIKDKTKGDGAMGQVWWKTRLLLQGEGPDAVEPVYIYGDDDGLPLITRVDFEH